MISKNIVQQIKPGVRVRVYEGTTPFEGLVIARKHGTEPGATFTVRTVIGGIGVEKVFPIHSPALTKAEIVSKPKRVRRSKLYYLRGMPQKKVRRKLGSSL